MNEKLREMMREQGVLVCLEILLEMVKNGCQGRFDLDVEEKDQIHSDLIFAFYLIEQSTIQHLDL